MKQRVTFRRVTEVTMEFEVPETSSRRKLETWARYGWSGGSAVDQAMRDDPGSCEVRTGDWEVLHAEPSLADEN